MNIYLIGMPGCGKSSVGLKLSEVLNYSYVDLDKYIESKACKSIPEIFDSVGEDGFRVLEKEALKDYSSKDSYVISCGGGIIKDVSNKKLMNGKVVYINVPLEVLEERIKGDKDNIRPMFRTKTVSELYEERKEKYEIFKDVEVKNIKVLDCVMDIIKELGLWRVKYL